MKAITQLLMLASAFAITSVQATPITINYTVDNTILDFGICANIGCSPIAGPSDFSTLFPSGSNQSNWKNADSYTFDLQPGTYEFAFIANNFGGGSANNPAGFLAEILWDGNSNISSSAWDVTTNGIDYVAATEWTKNGTGIWGGNLLGEISADAQWLWSANNFNSNTDSTAGFRTSITVPAPGILALLGLGLFGLGFSRKLRA
ncbi:PEP-CTERM sorting domain-containing protein [Psychromonas antarctica]|uniref:PEP-CTERM sorting domain-containing protein n=1 Tax=Psychromonas antarctica TaxID=67573 RepID=UPI001EE85567|nr:PEP-CTERM sorting domain-containing protein [Psychromonas antarctica]MCG6202793.1 PEP-CTERM sorting domain-containing protein [Psychromonas antarctica]